MQSSTDFTILLECFDCKEIFKSASLLLQHFAQHVISNDKGGICKTKKGKKESIVENVLKKSFIPIPDGFISSNWTKIQNDKQAILNSSESMFEEKETFSDNDICTLEKQLPCNKTNSIIQEIGERAKEKHKLSVETNGESVPLVKLDLQKRLENCVVKLTSRQEISRKIEQYHSNFYYVDVSTQDSDEFNPLKFCIATLDDNNEKPKNTGRVLNKAWDTTSKLTKSSCRKQLKPKRIFRNKKYTSPSLMKNELVNGKSLISTRRKYVCHFCSKSFGWSTDLKRHILTHTGERPFKCSSCDATFTRNFLLQKHENKVHFNKADNIFTCTSDKQPINKNYSLNSGSGAKNIDEEYSRHEFSDVDNEKINKSFEVCNDSVIDLGSMSVNHKNIKYLCLNNVNTLDMFSPKALNII